MTRPAEKLGKKVNLDRFHPKSYQLQQQLVLLEETRTGDRSHQDGTRSCIRDRKSLKEHFYSDEDQWRGRCQ